MMANKTKTMIELHKSGMSTSELAEIFGIKKNSVISLLTHWGALKPTLGIETEKRVVKFLKDKGHRVKRMRGDWRYDAEVDGKKVDIKSSGLHNYRGHLCYS